MEFLFTIPVCPLATNPRAEAKPSGFHRASLLSDQLFGHPHSPRSSLLPPRVSWQAWPRVLLVAHVEPPLRNASCFTGIVLNSLSSNNDVRGPVRRRQGDGHVLSLESRRHVGPQVLLVSRQRPQGPAAALGPSGWGPILFQSSVASRPASSGPPASFPPGLPCSWAARTHVQQEERL